MALFDVSLSSAGVTMDRDDLGGPGRTCCHTPGAASWGSAWTAGGRTVLSKRNREICSGNAKNRARGHVSFPEYSNEKDKKNSASGAGCSHQLMLNKCWRLASLLYVLCWTGVGWLHPTSQHNHTTTIHATQTPNTPNDTHHIHHSLLSLSFCVSLSVIFILADTISLKSQ